MRNPYPHSRFVGLIPGGIMNGIAGNAMDAPILICSTDSTGGPRSIGVRTMRIICGRFRRWRGGVGRRSGWLHEDGTAAGVCGLAHLIAPGQTSRRRRRKPPGCRRRSQSPRSGVDTEDDHVIGILVGNQHVGARGVDGEVAGLAARGRPLHRRERSLVALMAKTPMLFTPRVEV